MTGDETSAPDGVPLEESEWAILDRYFSETSAPDERQRVERWAAQSAANAREVARIRRVWAAGAQTLVRFDADAAWGVMQEHLEARQSSAPAARAAETGWPVAIGRRAEQPRGSARSIAWRSIGAVAALLVIGGGWLATRERSRLEPVPYTSYTTTSGQIAQLTLRDGSHVTLAPNTTLRVSRAFADRRDILLTGQAYFDVAPTRAPFVVRTGEIVTRVLGTQFDVRHYASDRSTRVVVLSGKVAVAGRQEVTLAAGGVGYVTDSTATASTVGSAQPYTAWTSGVLIFRDAPVSELLDVVGRWYNLEFRVTDSAIVNQTVVAEFPRGETRAEALQLIGKLLNVSMRFDDTSHGPVVVTLLPDRDGRGPEPAMSKTRGPLGSHLQEVGR